MGHLKTKILIVDGYPVSRHGLEAIVNAQPGWEVCGQADTMAEVLDCIKDKKPDLVVVEISATGGHGLELVKQIKTTYSSSRVLVCSLYQESLFAERALRAGAMGFVNKQQSLETILEAMRCVLRDQIYLTPRLAEQLLHPGQDHDGHARAPYGKTLSDREMEVFILIGEGQTTRQIAERLNRSLKTIETFRAKIKSKLKLKNSAELSRRAVQWVLESEH